MDANQKGLLAGRAMEEMLAVAKALKADTSTVSGPAGFGDFLATAYSPYSRNRGVGEEIAKHGKCNLKAEGVISLPFLMRRLGSNAPRFDLLNLIFAVSIDCKP